MAHPDAPSGGGILVAVTPRGSIRWLALPKLSAGSGYIDFLNRLLLCGPGPWDVRLHGPELGRLPGFNEWQASRAASLQVNSCPIALKARLAPEPTLSPSASAPYAASAASAAPATPPSPVREKEAPMSLNPSSLTHLQRLEAESIHIMREVVAEADKPVMLYSIGKDSAVMLHLARKAFYPAPPPFPLLHVDTTWKFRAMYEMRERSAKEAGMDLLVYQNPEAKELGINPFTHGSQIHTDMWKTQGLKQALDKYGFDVAFGGARRDEEKSRAKERIFSFRSAQHRWDPKNQRPELWRLYNGRKQKGESIRCFPISNWTELDIWQYIYLENIPIVPLYYAAERPVVERDGTLIMVDDDRFPLREGEVPMMKSVRFRTLGCYPLSGAVESEADTLTDIIQEMLLTKTSERQGRMIDHDSAASMEKKKQEGYF
jgi:sulfate adenylyltransferase subunit 2